MIIEGGPREMLCKQRPQCLVLIVLIFCAGVLTISRLESSASAGAETPTAAGGANTADSFISWRFAIDETTWPTELHRDIFQWKRARVIEAEAVSQVAAEQIRQQIRAKLRVNAIVIRDEASALVNGTVCRVGDSIEGFRVERIESRKVWFAKDGVEAEVGF